MGDNEQKVIPSEIKSFSITVNDIDIVNATEEKIEELELEQGYKAKFKIIINANLENMYKKGDYFKFELPTLIKDFGNLSGTSTSSEGEPKFKYTTFISDDKQFVKVALVDDLTPDQMTKEVNVKLKFESEFGFHGNDLEQEIEVPEIGGTGGSKTITLKFKPKTHEEKISKESLGVTIEDGERYIGWEVWVNTAGKTLTGATISDESSTSPDHSAHEIYGEIKVSKYEIGLGGVIDKDGDGTDTVKYNKFDKITLEGNNAYKIIYKTKVTEGEPSGETKFSNKVTFKNSDSGEENTTGSQTIQYGKVIDKSKVDGNNYKSNWKIQYNYNLASIDKPVGDEYNIKDTLSGPHNIDIESIEVYKMKADDEGKVTGREDNPVDENKYSITPILASGKVEGFELTFNDDIKDAYEITYEAKYDKDFFTEDNTTIKNEVFAGGKKDDAKHEVGQSILTKSYKLDLEKQELEWTIEITADNKEIENLTLTDVFAPKENDGKMGE